MKLYINKNISQRTYKIVGRENGNSIDLEMKIHELLSNSANDTELLYTLQESEIDKILDLQINQNHICKSTRDFNENNDIIITRIL